MKCFLNKNVDIYHFVKPTNLNIKIRENMYLFLSWRLEIWESIVKAKTVNKKGREAPKIKPRKEYLEIFKTAKSKRTD